MANRFLISISLFVLFASLSSAQQTSAPNHTRITLTRTPTTCEGGCLYYTVTISGNGDVEFSSFNLEAGRVVSNPVIEGNIDLVHVDELVREFERINYFSLTNRYGDGATNKQDKHCPKSWSHHPSAITSITVKGKSKEIYHYLGCAGHPLLDKLTALENKIDEIADTQRLLEQLRVASSTTSPPSNISSGLLSGLVLDEAGARVAGLWFLVEGEGFRKEVWSDREGRYETRLPAGRYRIKVPEGVWHKYESKPILIQAGKTVKHDFTLKRVRQDIDHP
jgi:hypothetical protein